MDEWRRKNDKELVCETTCWQKDQALPKIVVAIEVERLSRNARERAMKSKDLPGLDAHAPAFITTKNQLATGEVQTEFCLKHHRHRQENSFNTISKEMPTAIAGKLSQGVSMSSVMDYIRGSMFGSLNRDHLITEADLHNIKHQHNINCMQKASDDADSVL